MDPKRGFQQSLFLNNLYKPLLPKNSMRQKKGQLTLFIILGVVIIAAVAIALYFYNPELFPGQRIVAPDTFEVCAKKGIDKIILDLAPTAGFTGAYFNKTYQNTPVPYVCYTDEYYKPCVVQTPFLEKKFIESLSLLIEDQIETCYNDYIGDFERYGYDVQSGDIEVEMELQKDKIKLDITAPVTISDGTTTSGFQDFSFEIPTEIYSVVMLANNIVSFETTYGEYEIVKAQLLYPDMPVNAFKLGDGTVIYRINKNDIKYQFAVRSYVYPAGYGA